MSRKLTDAQHADAVERRRLIGECGACDEGGWVMRLGRAHRCTHEPEFDRTESRNL